MCSMDLHSEVQAIECKVCGKVLVNKRSYNTHYQMKHSGLSKGFGCRICENKFKTEIDRKLHYQNDHPGEHIFYCKECNMGFPSKSSISRHRQNVHKQTELFVCPYCSKEFTIKDSYKDHLLIHNGPRHKCIHCDKDFVQRSNLMRHMRVHTGEKPYKCTFCDKWFADKGACNSHIKVHTGAEICSCPYCGQTYRKLSKLKYHIRKHTGEGLIKCEVCEKSFTNNTALREHSAIHKRQSQILCVQCGKAYGDEKNLQRHIVTVHEPTHSYTCPLCPKSFSVPRSLKEHVMTHTSVKHIKCLLCASAYSTHKTLRKHLLSKHQVSPNHPHYKHCFYVMTPQEAGLKIPMAMPTDSVSATIVNNSDDQQAVGENEDSVGLEHVSVKGDPLGSEDDSEECDNTSDDGGNNFSVAEFLSINIHTVDDDDESPVLAHINESNSINETNVCENHDTELIEVKDFSESNKFVKGGTKIKTENDSSENIICDRNMEIELDSGSKASEKYGYETVFIKDEPAESCVISN